MTEDTDWAVRALAGVYDPCCREKGLSVVDMGLLRSVTLHDRHARVELLLTSGWCPFASRVLTDVEAAVTELPDVTEAEVRVVWDEPWDETRLSADARGKLRFMPAPAQVADREAFISDKLKQATLKQATFEPARQEASW